MYHISTNTVHWSVYLLTSIYLSIHVAIYPETHIHCTDTDYVSCCLGHPLNFFKHWLWKHCGLWILTSLQGSAFHSCTAKAGGYTSQGARSWDELNLEECSSTIGDSLYWIHQSLLQWVGTSHLCRVNPCRYQRGSTAPAPFPCWSAATAAELHRLLGSK